MRKGMRMNCERGGTRVLREEKNGRKVEKNRRMQVDRQTDRLTDRQP